MDFYSPSSLKQQSTGIHFAPLYSNHCVMVSLLTLECCRLWLWRSDQTKDYKICICCFCAKHTVLRRKIIAWLVHNQDNVSKWSKMYTSGLLFQWAGTIKIHRFLYFNSIIFKMRLKSSNTCFKASDVSQRICETTKWILPHLFFPGLFWSKFWFKLQSYIWFWAI
jgi:hypothetical protein